MNVQLSIYFNHLHLSGIALASSLVTLGNPRKASVDPTQKVVLSAFVVIFDFIVSSAFIVPSALQSFQPVSLKMDE